MFVSIAGRTNASMTDYGKEVAMGLNVPFIERKKLSIQTLQANYHDDCIIVGKERLEMYLRNAEAPFFFHPNSASFRIKRLLKGEHDPFVHATNLKKGMSILDCTMGLASDSIVSAFVVGESGKVVSLEGNQYLSYIVNHGLQTWNSCLLQINSAMRRIKVISTTYDDFLRKCPDNMVDVIYFDPMFEESVLTSDGIKALKDFAIYGGITANTIEEAKRVAKDRIVLKDHFRSSTFKEYQFQVFTRKSAKFHYGVLNL